MSDPKANPTNLRKYARGDFSIRGGLMRMAAAEIERLRDALREIAPDACRCAIDPDGNVFRKCVLCRALETDDE